MRPRSLLFSLPRVRAHVPHAAGRAHTNLLISAPHRSPRQWPSTSACDRRVETPLLRWMFAHDDARLRPRFYTSSAVLSRSASLTFASSASFFFRALLFLSNVSVGRSPPRSARRLTLNLGLDGILIGDASGKLRCAMRTWAHTRKSSRN